MIDVGWKGAANFGAWAHHENMSFGSGTQFEFCSCIGRSEVIRKIWAGGHCQDPQVPKGCNNKH